MSFLMNFEYLLKTEEETSSISVTQDSSWFEVYPECANSFFQVVYFVGEEDDPSSLEGMFLTFAHNHYLKIPYSLRAIMILLNKGYYAESALLVRNLFETLVQLRYFHKHKDKLNNHVLKTKKVSIRQMVCEFNENLYTTVYAALSTVAHAEFGSLVFRANYSSAQGGKTIMGSIYNKQFYYFILNQLSAITYGLLNFINIFFDHYGGLVPSKVEDIRCKTLNSVKDVIYSEPKSKDFLKDISSLIGLTVEF